jgi:hypothetical protein
MNTLKIRNWLISLVLGSLILTAGCAVAEEPSRWDAAQEASSGERATAGDALAGGEFNKFFPESEGDYSVVYTQEKRGFAEAVLKEDGADVATLAVFDTLSNPDTATKYTESTQEIGGYPAVAVGDNGTAILVADRFQVQIRSQLDDFDEADRAEWLQAFDLGGLAQLAQ